MVSHLLLLLIFKLNLRKFNLQITIYMLFVVFFFILVLHTRFDISPQYNVNNQLLTDYHAVKISINYHQNRQIKKHTFIIHFCRNPYLQISYRNTYIAWKSPRSTKIKRRGFTVSRGDSNPSHGASYRAAGCACVSVLTPPVCAARARLLHSSVDDMCCQLSGEDSLLRYRLFPAWLGTERVTGQGVYWNTVFSSAAVQLQYSRNIVLLCGCFPRPAP